jgi:DHA1 family bicyclomycin/chloramphenicol resistance-like MFS transporter
MAGAALSNLLWGWLADRYGNKPVILGSILSGGMATAVALVVLSIWPPAYALVFVFVGAMLSGMKIGYSNFILEMAEPTMRATCVALQNTIIIPITALPLVTGILLESFSFPTIFAGELILLTAGFIVSLKLIDPRDHEAGICIIAD